MKTFIAGSKVRLSGAHLKTLNKARADRQRPRIGVVMDVVGFLHDGGGEVVRVLWDDDSVGMLLSYNLQGV